VGEALLGVSAGVRGTIVIDPCVPDGWYKTGFGIENPGILQDRDVGFTYGADRVHGWIRGKPGKQSIRMLLPPNVKAVRVLQDGHNIRHNESGKYSTFVLDLHDERPKTFAIQQAN